MFKLYRTPAPEEEIVIAADPADGGSDYCAAVAKSRKHFDTLMTFHAHMDSNQFGHELNKMAKFIHRHTNVHPVIGVERNTGMATIYVLQQLNYPRLFRMPNNVGEEDMPDQKKIGWMTTAASRAKMLDDLARTILQRSSVIPDEETILEMLAFIKNPRTGKPEASPGKHDDLVLAEAIAGQMLQYSPSRAPSDWRQTLAKFPDLGLPDYVN